MNRWALPRSLTVGGRAWAVHTDFRDVLKVLAWLDDRSRALRDEERWYVALALFYRDFEAMPPDLYAEAAARMGEFLAGGRKTDRPAGPRLIDWDKDAALIAAEVNRVAGCEVRALPYLHWWSFLGWFSAIGDGALATVVSIRDKLRRGKRLEGWELAYYRAHRSDIDLREPLTDAERDQRRRLLELVGAKGEGTNGEHHRI